MDDDQEPARRTARHVRTVDDVLALMDGLFAADADRWTAGAGAAWWDDFYADRDRPAPFLVDAPDENLVAWLADGRVRPRRALDLGCGNGRNARYLAAHGSDVDAIDLSPAAIAWAREHGTGPDGPRFHTGDAFGDAGAGLTGPYDLVYDSGLLHHLPPHRRVSYLRLVERVLAPGGTLGVVCFHAGHLGSTAPDEELYLRGGLDGGIAFTADELRRLFADLEHVETRPMVEQRGTARFGEAFLLTALFRRPAADAA